MPLKEWKKDDLEQLQIVCDQIGYFGLNSATDFGDQCQ